MLKILKVDTKKINSIYFLHLNWERERGGRKEFYDNKVRIYNITTMMKIWWMLETKINLNFCAIINAYIIIDNKTADFDIYSYLIHATLFIKVLHSVPISYRWYSFLLAIKSAAQRHASMLPYERRWFRRVTAIKLESTRATYARFTRDLKPYLAADHISRVDFKPWLNVL